MMRLLHQVLGWLSLSPKEAPGLYAAVVLLQLVGAYLVLRYFLNNIVGRIVVSILTKELGGQNKARAARVQTLAGVVRSTGNYLLTFIIVVVALGMFGVDTKPVLASASVIGLAVAFGSQKLVRDVTTGFLMLAEDQFDVGNYVTIGAVTGTVEDVGMRTTRIRDDVGKLYILSNGDISQVCNQSDGPVTLFLDVAVALASDLTRVRAAVEDAAAQVEAEFGESLLEQPSLFGITTLTAASMTVRVRYRAVVARQERIQMRLRELVRERFAAEGIALA